MIEKLQEFLYNNKLALRVSVDKKGAILELWRDSGEWEAQLTGRIKCGAAEVVDAYNIETLPEYHKKR